MNTKTIVLVAGGALIVCAGIGIGIYAETHKTVADICATDPGSRQCIQTQEPPQVEDPSLMEPTPAPMPVATPIPNAPKPSSEQAIDPGFNMDQAADA